MEGPKRLLNKRGKNYQYGTIASYKGDVDIVRLLIEAGADVDEANKYGLTPFSIACHFGHEAVSKLILSRSFTKICEECYHDVTCIADFIFENKRNQEKPEKRNRSESEEEKSLPKKVRTK